MSKSYIPAIVEPRCHVCASDLREFIDRMTVQGFRPAFIARQVQHIDQSLSRSSIERHIQRHIDYEQAALREILEDRAREAGILTQESKHNILTRQAVLDQMIKNTWNRMLNGERVPFEVGLKALELQEQFEREEIGVMAETYQRQLDAIIRAIREIVPVDLHEALARRAESIFTEPALKELEAPPLDT